MQITDEENRDLHTGIGGFLRLNIAKKVLLGYLSLALLIVVISVFTLFFLKRLNSVNESIIKTDVPLMEYSSKMIDALLAQELYAKRYEILKSPEMLILYWKRNEEFDQSLQQMRSIPDLNAVPVDRIRALHTEYNHHFTGIIELADQTSLTKIDYDYAMKEIQDELISLLKTISSNAGRSQNEKTIMTSQLGNTAFKITAAFCVLGLLLGISSSMLITRYISRSVNRLKAATREIGEGKYDTPHVIDGKAQDEMGELSHAFREMATRLKRLEEIHIDANPLTRLPGGLAIDSVLQKRVESGAPLAFCVLDLDNFKAYNDRYGYASGSEVIKAVARIVDKVVSRFGSTNDFCGHIGGDDFVIITSPDRYAIICKEVISEFDMMIPGWYNDEDRKKGFIKGKNRQGVEMDFPLMTISIAVVTNQQMRLKSALEIGELAAELKEYAKSLNGSIYVVDKRRRDISDNADEDNVIRLSMES